MLATLQQARDSTLRKVASVCPSSTDFAALVNEATQRLMRRGDWSGTVVPMYVCVKRGCIVFPREVGEVRKSNFCNNTIPVENGWYRYLDYNAGKDWSQCSWWGWRDRGAELVETYQSPVFTDILGEGRTVRVYPQASPDIGKTVTLFGEDNDGQPLKTVNSDGTWSAGLSITIASPFGSTSTYVRRIDRVVRQETTAPVTMYAYNVTEDVLEDLATYQPTDTNPSFKRFNLSGGHGCSGPSCTTAKPLIALVKLRFIPARAASDLVLIENLDALKEMIMSVKYAEAGNAQQAATFEARAIRELNMGLRDGGDDTIPVSIEPFNGLRIGRQQML